VEVSKKIRREFEKVIYKSGRCGRVPIVLSVLIVVYLRTEANSKPLLQSMNRFDSAIRMLFDEPSSFF
jgi:hypothetical protein